MTLTRIDICLLLPLSLLSICSPVTLALRCWDGSGSNDGGFNARELDCTDGSVQCCSQIMYQRTSDFHSDRYFCANAKPGYVAKFNIGNGCAIIERFPVFNKEIEACCCATDLCNKRL